MFQIIESDGGESTIDDGGTPTDAGDDRLLFTPGSPAGPTATIEYQALDPRGGVGSSTVAVFVNADASLPDGVRSALATDPPAEGYVAGSLPGRSGHGWARGHRDHRRRLRHHGDATSTTIVKSTSSGGSRRTTTTAKKSVSSDHHARRRRPPPVRAEAAPRARPRTRRNRQPPPRSRVAATPRRRRPIVGRRRTPTPTASASGDTHSPAPPRRLPGRASSFSSARSPGSCRCPGRPGA